MNHIFTKLGFRKPDEMEKAILFRAQRNAYIFLVITLVAWSLYESYNVYIHHSRLNLFPCFLLVTALIIQTLSQLIMTRNAVKDDKDSYETEPLVKIILLICVLFSVMATIAAAIVFLNVRV